MKPPQCIEPGIMYTCSSIWSSDDPITLGLSRPPKVCKIPLPNALFPGISDHTYITCIITALMVNVRSNLHMFVTCWNGSHGDGSCQWLVEVQQLWMKRARWANWFVTPNVSYFRNPQGLLIIISNTMHPLLRGCCICSHNHFSYGCTTKVLLHKIMC